MKVSIIIPTYKGSSAISRAIESVLDQTYGNIEVIVVDDNSPDSVERKKTELLLEKYSSDKRVVYIKHERNKNGAAARNTGIQAASGEFIAFLDDDDYYLPKRIEYSKKYLEEHQDAIGVYVGVDVIDGTGNITLQVRPAQDLTIASILTENMVLGTGSNIFLRRDVLNKVKGFDEEFIRFQDLEFMIRVCREGRIGYITDLMIVKSVNGTSNHPEYKKMRAVIKQFTNKFKQEIYNLGDKTNTYFATQSRALFDIALYERQVDEIKEARELIKKYDRLSLKEHLLSFVYISKIRDWRVVSFLISIQKRIISVFIHK